ncbi:MAG: uncharacterized protein JWP46_2911 [Modestobacter sp.]|jgi:hypothetical protein|nr:uncharacterized protein [Modestobacter sp.]
MRLRPTAAAVVLFTGLTVPLAGTALAADVDCADFASQAQAQAVLVGDPGDPNGLDANRNGVACENYPYAATSPGPGTQVAAVPAGGVAAGDGTAAAGSSPEGSALPYVLGGLAFAAAGGSLVAARRTARRPA